MMGLTGTPQLIRLILRRDRIRISVWIAGIALLGYVSAASVKSLFPTQAAIDQASAKYDYSAKTASLNFAVGLLR